MKVASGLPIVCEDVALIDPAQMLAERLGSKVIQNFDQRAQNVPAFILKLTNDGLAIHQTGKQAPGPIKVDFASGAVEHRRKFGGGKGQMIAKAVGVKANHCLRVFDATPGLGRDAFVLASLGCHVTLMERVPVVFELLRDGISRALDSDNQSASDIVTRMQLKEGDSLEYLQGISSQADLIKPDVIYLDPMFPERNKSAKVKKEMLAFHHIVGADEDCDRLLGVALNAALYRVVVKRPAKAPFLENHQPSYQLKGKTSRYDIYTLKKIPDNLKA